MSSGNYKDLTPDDNYASVELTGDSIVLPPDAEDVILVVEGDSSISGTVNVELEHSNDNVNFTTAKNKPVGAGAAASYSLSSFSQVAEGGSITVNLSTTGVDEGVLIPYTITGIQAADLTSGSLTGTMEIGATGNASVTLQPVEDLVAESETMTFTIGSSGNPLDSITIDILDTSYSITPVATSMDEDSILVFNVSTTNVANGTTLYWTINHGTSATADFVAESGSFTVTNNLGSFSVQTTADQRTEGSETFTTEVRLGSISGTVAATSSTITINDTSVPTAPVGFSNKYYIKGQSLSTSSIVTDFQVAGTSDLNLIPSQGYDSGTSTYDPTYLPKLDNAWSISFWLKTDSTSQMDILHMYRSNGVGFAVTVSSGVVTLCYSSALGARIFMRILNPVDGQGNALTVTGEWIHVAIAKPTGVPSTSNATKIWLNGVAQTVSPQSASGTLLVGAFGLSAIANTRIFANQFSSSSGSAVSRTANILEMDELAGWNKELTQSDVDIIYGNGTAVDLANTSIASDLDSHFRMGDAANDDVANNRAYDEKDSLKYIEKVGTGTHAITQLASSDAPYVAPLAPAGFSNEYYLGGHAVTTQQDDYSINGTEKSLFPSKGGGTNYFPTLSDTWSISFWMKGDTNPSGNVSIFQILNGTNTQVKLYQISNNLYLSFNASANARSNLYSLGSGALFTGNWRHVVLTKPTAMSFKIYIDGTQYTLSQTSANLLSSDFTNKSITKTVFGGALVSAVSGNYLSRSATAIDLDQIKTWSTELTQSQVSEMYNSGTPIATSDLSFASNIDAEFLCGDGANDNVAGNQSYDIQDNTRYIEKVGTGTFGISQLTSSDSIYVASSAPSGFTNEYYVSDQYRGSVTGSDLTGNYYRDSSTDKIGFFPDLDLGTDFRNSNTVSYSFWYQRPVSGTENTFSDIFSEKYDNAGPNGQSVFHSYIYGDRLVIYTTYNNTDNQKEYTIPNDDNWHHITITTNSDDVVTGANLYIDGSLATPVFSDTSNTIIRTGHSVNTLTFGGASSARNLASGTVTSGLPTGNFIIDEFSTWKKQLSASEVSSLWNSGTPGDLSQHSASSDLQRWFRFGDTSVDGTSIKDSLNTSVELVSYDSQNNITQYPPPFSNEKYVSDAYRGAVTGSDLVGNYYRDSSTDKKGMFPDLDSTTGFRSSNNVSYSFWCTFTGTGGYAAIYQERYDTTATTYQSYLSFYEKSNLLWVYSAYDGGSNYKYCTVPSDNDWHHVVITTTTDNVSVGASIYIDGIAAATTSGSQDGGIVAGGRSHPVNTINFGGTLYDRFGANGTFTGSNSATGTLNIDEFSTWKKTLSASEVTELYNSRNSLDLTKHSASADLQRWFRFGDTSGDGTAIKDSQETSVELVSFDSQDNTTQLTMNDAPYYSASNRKYVSDAYRGAVSTALTGNYYRDSSTDKKGFFPDLDQATDFRSSNNVSYSFWYKRPVSGTFAAEYSPIFSERYDNAASGGQSFYTVYIYNYRIAPLSTYNGNFNYKSYDIPNDDKWHHVVVTTTSADVASGATVYIDGSVVTAASTSTSYTITRTGHSVNTINFGGRIYDWTASTGTVNTTVPTGNLIIDEFSTWKKTLSASEVSELYELSDLTQHSASADLQRWFRFGDTTGDGTAIKDSQETSVELISFDSQDNTQDH